MKGLAILMAIVAAFVSGVGVGNTSPDKQEARTLGALLFLMLSVWCGMCAWR